MKTLEAVQTALQGWPQPRVDGQTVVVPTHCLYPSNGIVHVHIDAHQEGFMVHDDRGALEEFQSSVGLEEVDRRPMVSAAYRRGVLLGRGYALYLARVPEPALAAAIVTMANASRDVATHLIERYKPRPRRPLSKELEFILDTRFPSRWRREEAFVGASQKQHRFDYVVNLSNQGRLLMDIVKPEPSSINAAVVSHLDVRNAHPDGYIHRVIYDDDERWSSENLSLLRVVATPIALSAANEALARLAA